MATAEATIIDFETRTVIHDQPAPHPHAIGGPVPLRELTLADGHVLCDFVKLLEEMDEEGT